MPTSLPSRSTTFAAPGRPGVLVITTTACGQPRGVRTSGVGGARAHHLEDAQHGAAQLPARVQQRVVVRAEGP